MIEWDIEEREETEASETWEILDDSAADWAVRKIADYRAERDRLMALINQRIDELKAKKERIEEQYKKDTGFFTMALYRYFGTIKPKETKTQGSYKLLSGKLVRKNSYFEIERGDDFLEWVKKAKPEYIKTTESVDWSALKKELQIVDGSVITSDGEMVEGAKAVLVPESFEVKL